MRKKQESEFGKGFIYNLILFAKHWGRIENDLEAYKSIGDKQGAYGIWFYGAADHFFEFEIPKQFKKKKIGKLAKWLRNKCLDFRLPLTREKKPTEKDFEEIFEKLEELARLIDKELGIKTIKATWR